MKRIFAMLCLFLSLVCSGGAGTKPSVLFINIDDLNDWNSVLDGHPQAITPNIQRLADRGVTFTRALCSSPVCYPSRTSLFSGIHPAKSGAISNFNWAKPWRFYVGDATTLPKHFGNNGWTTYGAAKNFHWGNEAEFDHYFSQRREPKAVPGTGYSAGPFGWGVASVPYEKMPDHIAVNWALKQFKAADTPSFFSIGIYKPHVTWFLPQSCFDKYPIGSFELPARQTGDLADLPERLKRLAHNEAKFGTGFHAQLEEDGQVELWARAYLAAVTFADEQLGRLLDGWDASPFAKNGYIVLWSDHGFMLGEKEGWGKFKPWYDASHCNMIMAGPGLAKGVECDKAVALLDLYPTLVELLDLPAPAPQKLDGNSLVPLLHHPQMEWNRPVTMSHEEDGVRYDSVMDNRYRMTRLITGETELYDHRTDPHEWTNLADRPESRETIRRLEKHLSFGHPALPAGGWIEAEALPCQTSADYGQRGNYHYRLNDKRASGDAVLCAHLIQGPKSYVDLVVDIPRAGTYKLATVVLPSGSETRIEVSAGAVVDRASQACADVSLPIQLNGFEGSGTHGLGCAEFESAGLHIIRFMTMGEDPCELRIDRLSVAQEERSI